MKNTYLFLLFIFIIIDSNAQRKIKKVEIEEIGYSIDLNFHPKTETLKYDDLILKITPLSTSVLNSKFLNESNYNGKLKYTYYDKSRNSFFLKKPKRKKEKTDFEFLLEGIDWLLDEEKINNDEYNKLASKIISNYDNESLTKINNTNYIISANPYFIDEKYLSTFEIEIFNPTNTYKKFSKKLLIETGGSLLSPFSTEEITEQLNLDNFLNQKKSKILKAYNLPNELIIPPKSKFIKYFSIPFINYIDKELKISFEGLPEKFHWEVLKNQDSFNVNYTFFELDVDWLYGNSFGDGDDFFILNSSENIKHSDNNIYIDEKNINEEFELISISLNYNKLYFIRYKIKGTDYINMQNNRRKIILLKSLKLEELKKKIKK